jgi:hypothetical protein
MKKTFLALLFLGLLTPLFAVTWKLQSAPFCFTSCCCDGVNPRASSERSVFFTETAGKLRNGTITFHYSLPREIKMATLNIYNVEGVRLESIRLVSGGKVAELNPSKIKIPTGIYFASIRAGTLEKTIRISIVK